MKKRIVENILTPNELEEIIENNIPIHQMTLMFREERRYLTNFSKDVANKMARMYTKNREEFQKRYEDWLLMIEPNQIEKGAKGINNYLIENYDPQSRTVEMDPLRKPEEFGKLNGAGMTVLKKLMNKRGWNVQSYYFFKNYKEGDEKKTIIHPKSNRTEESKKYNNLIEPHHNPPAKVSGFYRGD